MGSINIRLNQQNNLLYCIDSRPADALKAAQQAMKKELGLCIIRTKGNLNQWNNSLSMILEGLKL
jgi:hypothetical protein